MPENLNPDQQARADLDAAKEVLRLAVAGAKKVGGSRGARQVEEARMAYIKRLENAAKTARERGASKGTIDNLRDVASKAKADKRTGGYDGYTGLNSSEGSSGGGWT